MADAARRAAYGFGFRAEGLAVLALRLKGYRVLARRWKCSAGEVDIIARRGATVAFVEVKARQSRRAALEAVGPRQRARVERAALVWLAGAPARFRPHSGGSLRFDVVLVSPWRWPAHLPNAWVPEGGRHGGW